jgi:hypothetical protein
MLRLWENGSQRLTSLGQRHGAMFGTGMLSIASSASTMLIYPQAMGLVTQRLHQNSQT